MVKNQVYIVGRNILDFILDQKEQYPVLREVGDAYIVAYKGMAMSAPTAFIAAGVYVAANRTLEKVESTLNRIVDLYLDLH